ncbi:Panacea domain-containing protein [Actinokineospora spheciospongiae]|uniref:Panacea domain-containing protein n=1 Tax=Actinokineospora spheciospongiae TaxID=909613 RepID=UPI00054FA1F4|nr:type II toxin-antitoxin system antitoxin SocA domain-containing protein [Actinokineospora spheciospongiae]PWW65486.1 putative phage-associated protein [Actinokineospora spheciospongiae]
MARVDDVAAAVLEKTGAVTTMKLQKLVYYCQAWHLVRTKQAMFEDRIEAWPQGPVVKSLFLKHRGQLLVGAWPGDARNLDVEERATLDWVHQKYGKLSAESLSGMTHIESPWKNARGLSGPEEKSSEEITKEQIHHYYARQVVDPEQAVAYAAANAAIEGVEFDDDWQAVLRSVANSTVSPDDAIRAEIERALRT